MALWAGTPEVEYRRVPANSDNDVSCPAVTSVLFAYSRAAGVCHRFAVSHDGHLLEENRLVVQKRDIAESTQPFQKRLAIHINK